MVVVFRTPTTGAYQHPRFLLTAHYFLLTYYKLQQQVFFPMASTTGYHSSPLPASVPLSPPPPPLDTTPHLPQKVFADIYARYPNYRIAIFFIKAEKEEIFR